MRERLLAAVAARLESDDPEALFGEDAQVEVDELLGFLAIPGDADAHVAHLAGAFHLTRGARLGDEGKPDLVIASVLLLPVLLSQPDALPEPVRRWLEPSRERLIQAGDTPAQAMGRSLTEVVWLLLDRLVRRAETDRDGLVAGVAELALSALPAGHEARPGALCAYGYALLNAADPAAGDASDARVERMVEVFRASFDAMPAGDRHYARCANGLGGALAMKAERAGDKQLMAEAARMFRIAADPASGGDPQLVQGAAESAREAEVWARPDGLLGQMWQTLDQMEELGRTLVDRRAELEQERTRRGGAPPEVDRALAELDDAKAQIDRQRHEMREMLAGAERAFRGAGEPRPDENDLGRQVAAMLQAGLGDDPRMPDVAALNPQYFRDLGYLARSAFETLDDMMREHMLGSGDRRRPLLEMQLASPVSDRSDLDEIVGLHERALRELPPDSLAHSQVHASYLALSTEQITDLDVRRRELPQRAEELNRVVAELMRRQLDERGGLEGDAAVDAVSTSPFESMAEANEAVTQSRLRLAAMPPDDPDRRSEQIALASALFRRYMLTNEDEAFHEAVDAARLTIADDQPPDVTLLLMWGATAMLRDPSDRQPGEHRPEPASERSLFATLRIIEGDAEGALASWEAGRAHLLSAALISRSELERLRAVVPEQAARLVALRGRIRAESRFGEPTPVPLSREWNAVLDEIRARPGFERFLMPPGVTSADLAPAAAEGPVIAINLDRARCDALVLRDGAASVVPLPELRVGELAEQADAFRDAIGTLSASESDRLLRGVAGRVVVDTLAWLWDVLAEPVLAAAVPAGGGPPWTRVWWSPSGPLNFLPLHAAGRHDVPGASVLDRAVSSYTPTVRALLHSRARPMPEGARTALAVAMPETPNHAALPATAREAAAFAAAFTGGAAAPDVLVGPAATTEAVCAALPGAAFAHFACHASSDPLNAEASHLVLHDGPLAVTELSRLPLDGAQLAYLSACATARGSATLADDALHLASAFQLAGFAQAIGTLWEVGDAAAAHMAEQVHQELARNLDDRTERPAAAHALHTVTRRMRAERPDAPWTWAAHVHSGA